MPPVCQVVPMELKKNWTGNPMSVKSVNYLKYVLDLSRASCTVVRDLLPLVIHQKKLD